MSGRVAGRDESSRRGEGDRLERGKEGPSGSGACARSAAERWLTGERREREKRRTGRRRPCREEGRGRER